jgi:Ca2+-binding RTX toxin-like protein
VAAHTVSVGALAVQTDAAGARILVIGGSAGDDLIQVRPTNDPDLILVRIREIEYSVRRRSPVESPLQQIVVFGQAGDDRIHIQAKLDIPAELYGGDGDDQLRGGDGNDRLHGGDGDDDLHGGDGDDILLGESGDDRLHGDKGRDLLIGGRGGDDLHGQGDDDIFIAGFTAWDNDPAALDAVLAEWTSGRDYVQRSDALRTSYLQSTGPAATVFDDAAEDRLVGSAGQDWFFAQLDWWEGGMAVVRVRIDGRHPTEIIDDLFFIESDG